MASKMPSRILKKECAGILENMKVRPSALPQLTICFLMDFPIHIDAVSMELPIVTFKGSQVDFS